MSKVKIEAPWYAFHKKVKALFAGDKDIEIGDLYKPQEGEKSYLAFDILVRKHEKFLAMDKVMPATVEFGNVTVGICVQDLENGFDEAHPVQLFAAIFDGNPHVKDVKEVRDVTGTVHGYVRFKPEVLQFFHDDLSDYNGNWSGLAQEIAKEVFSDMAGMHFCTAPVGEKEGETNAPLGEWP